MKKQVQHLKQLLAVLESAPVTRFQPQIDDMKLDVRNEIDALDELITYNIHHNLTSQQ